MEASATRGKGCDRRVKSTAAESYTLLLAVSAFTVGFSMCETKFSYLKYNKDYYHCSFQRRFNCEYEIRVMRDVETGLINIEASRRVQRSHEPESDVCSRAFPCIYRRYCMILLSMV